MEKKKGSRRMHSLMVAFVMALSCVTPMGLAHALAAPGEAAAPAAVFSEDFQSSENTDEWENAFHGNAAKLAIVAEPEKEENKVLQLERIQKNDTYLISYDLGQKINNGVVELSFRMRTNTVDGTTNCYFIAADDRANFSGDGVISQMGLYGGLGKASYQVGGTTQGSGVALKADTWYQFKLVLDADAHMYHLFIDDTQVATNQAYTKNVALQRIWIGIGGGTMAKAMFDDFKVVKHTDRTYQEVLPVKVKTVAGVAPQLPESMDMVDQWGFTHAVKIEWNEIPADDYKNVGTFAVKGIVEGTTTEVRADVEVIPNTEGQIIYEDDFQREDASTSGWENPYGSKAAELKIAQVPGVEGNQALQIHKQKPSSSSYLIKRDLTDVLDQGIVDVSFKMMVNKLEHGDVAYFIVSSDADRVSHEMIITQMGTYGMYSFGGHKGSLGNQTGDGTTPLYIAEPNTWYRIRLVYDTQEKLYNMFIDDQLVLNSHDYNASGAEIQNLWIGTGGSSAMDTYFDDIKVVQYLAPEFEYTAVPVRVDTTAGVKPQMPETVSVRDQWGFEKTVGVTWPEIDPSKYSTEGKQFDIIGTTENALEITATISIRAQQEKLYEEDFSDESSLEKWPEGWNIQKVAGEKVLTIPQGAAASVGTMMLPQESIPAMTTERIVVEARLRVDNKAAGATLSVMNENGQRITEIALHKDKGKLCIGSFGGNSSMGYYGFDDFEADKWVPIKFVFCPIQQRYHVYLNDKLVMANMGFQAEGTIGGIKIAAMNTQAGNVYADDIVISVDRVEPKFNVAGLDLSVEKGKAVELPTMVPVNYEDGFVDVWEVQWEDYDHVADKNAEITGVATSTWAQAYGNKVTHTITANVTVREAAKQAFFVDPVNGKDTNDGTSEANAFQTLEKAREAVRTVNDHMTSDLYVYLMDGVYERTETFELTAEDSGSNGYFVHWAAAPGAEPVISGGKQITEWEKVEGENYYVASASKEEGYPEFLRHLYVNEERATRASSGWMNAKGFVYDSKGNQAGWKLANSDIQNYQNMTDLSIFKVQGFKMDEYRVRGVEDLGDDTSAFTLTNEEDRLFAYRKGGMYMSGNAKVMVVNALEELDVPGEWCYQSSTGKVYYYPYDDQNMNSIETYTTVMEDDQLLRLEGQTGREVCNVSIEGLTFKYSNWTYPTKYGIGGSQAEILFSLYGLVDDITYGHEMEGAIRLNHTRNIDLKDNVIAHTGGSGIHIYNDAQSTRVEGNVSYDTTGAAVVIGRYCGVYLNDYRNEQETDKFGGTNMEGRVSNTVVTNNYITDTGRDFFQATGVDILASTRNTITHNYIVNTAYMGIHNRTEVAGQYLNRNGGRYYAPGTDTTTDVGQNIIAYNHLGECSWAYSYGMVDAASIYSFGPVSGTLIAQNYMESTSGSQSLGSDNNSHNQIWRDNRYTDAPIHITARTAVVDKHSMFETNNNKTGMEDVIANAGLQRAYEQIVDKAILPTAHEDYVKYNHLRVTTPQKAATPNAAVDYAAEKLTGLSANGIYLIQDKIYTSEADGTIAIEESWMGQTLTIIRKGASDDKNSDAQNLTLAARPAAPVCIAVQPTEETLGSVSGITESMEYSLDNGATWIKGTGTELTGLSDVTVQIRVAATEVAFCGAVQELKIEKAPVDPEEPDVPHYPHHPIKPSEPEEKPVLPFADVAEHQWYYDSVYSAWEQNLINGMDDTHFAPDQALTVAETIKLAAVTHQRDKLGQVTLQNGQEQWYTTYVDYAIANDIIDASYADDTPAQMNAAVTRSEFVKILHGALESYALINEIADNAIPDVKMESENAAEIYEFYRAGILNGSDAEGTFLPDSRIKRSEVAAILVRMYDFSARLSFAM